MVSIGLKEKNPGCCGMERVVVCLYMPRPMSRFVRCCTSNDMISRAKNRESTGRDPQRVNSGLADRRRCRELSVECADDDVALH
jgi:hypothetical protein